jgi:hypothetical protein
MQNEERINGLETQVRTLKRIVYGFGCLLFFGLQISAQFGTESVDEVYVPFTEHILEVVDTGQYGSTTHSLNAMQLVFPLFAIAILLFVINRSTKDAGKSTKWHYKLNNWIVENLSIINACTFILIVVISAYAGGIIMYNQWVGLLIGFTVGSIFGCLYCGLLSIILMSGKNLGHIASSLSKIEKSRNK